MSGIADPDDARWSMPGRRAQRPRSPRPGSKRQIKLPFDQFRLFINPSMLHRPRHLEDKRRGVEPLRVRPHALRALHRRDAQPVGGCNLLKPRHRSVHVARPDGGTRRSTSRHGGEDDARRRWGACVAVEEHPQRGAQRCVRRRVVDRVAAQDPIEAQRTGTTPREARRFEGGEVLR